MISVNPQQQQEADRSVQSAAQKASKKAGQRAYAESGGSSEDSPGQRIAADMIKSVTMHKGGIVHGKKSEEFPVPEDRASEYRKVYLRRKGSKQ